MVIVVVVVGVRVAADLFRQLRIIDRQPLGKHVFTARLGGDDVGIERTVAEKNAVVAFRRFLVM